VAREIETGEYLYYVLREFAIDKGFRCDHPLSRHVLHKKGNKNLFRCADCGYLFYKIYDKPVDKWVMKPRIEVL
jgi:hypothetical protein